MQTEENKTVDIDTSGPGAEIELEDQQQDTEQKEEASPSTPATETEKPVEAKPEASSEEPEAQPEEKKDELKDYSESVQRRIAKLTKKWREAERQKEEALTYAKSVISENDSLLKKYNSLETTNFKDREERIKSGMQAAAAKLAAAKEASDFTAEVEAQKEIAKLGYEEGRLQELKATAERVNAEEKRPAPASPADVQVPQSRQITDPKAEAWAAKNTWFGKEKAMTYTAFDLHRNLVEEEGFDPQTDEYYAEIDKRIRLEFPHKFANNSDKVENSTTKPTQTVASATRSVKPGRKTVRLTSSQVAIAKKLGVPLEEYAKQLKLTKEV